MEVKIVHFPETRVAALEHYGPPENEHESAKKLVEWRIANKMFGEKYQSYGVHYTNPHTAAPHQHRVDFCISVTEEVSPNPQQVVNKSIPGGRCVVARHFGSRDNVTVAKHLFEQWLPKSGESLRNFPIFFHYINVGPNIKPEEMITDVYLPIR